MAFAGNLNNQLAGQRRIAEENDAKRRAATLGFSYLNLVSTTVPTELKALELVPRAEAERALLAPLQFVGGKKVALAAFNPGTPEAHAIIERLKSTFEVEVFVGSKTGIEHCLSYYNYIPEAAKEISGRVDINRERFTDILGKTLTLEDLRAEIEGFSSPLVSQMLEIVLAGALALRASDVHIEPSEGKSALRLRIDGLLHAATENLQTHVAQSLTTRIKLLSNLKLNVKNEAQDGRFTIGLQDRNIEIRTSVIPSEYGETVVMRLLDPVSIQVNLEALGWRADDLAIVKEEVKKPNGLILNTGPTGSGKTTTLYAFLTYTFRPDIKVITIEDPIEYHLEGISQTQVNDAVGYTFADGLRSILRQDPNIILVGEIRDAETAGIAMNASLTGHIVFSTLHTNDAVGAIPRLIDLGVKPQVLGPALSLIIAQRLVRVLCPKCKVRREVDQKTADAIGVFLKGLPERVSRTDYAQPVLFEPKGCVECGKLGYRGRTSIFELLKVTEPVEQAIYTNPTEMQLKTLSREQGMVTMQEDGILKILRGITTIDEVERLTGKIEWLHT
jgi:type IV pilus assembly protein PilB